MTFKATLLPQKVDKIPWNVDQVYTIIQIFVTAVVWLKSFQTIWKINSYSTTSYQTDNHWYISSLKKWQKRSTSSKSYLCFLCCDLFNCYFFQNFTCTINNKLQKVKNNVTPAYYFQLLISWEQGDAIKKDNNVTFIV